MIIQAKGIEKSIADLKVLKGVDLRDNFLMAACIVSSLSVCQSCLSVFAAVPPVAPSRIQQSSYGSFSAASGKGKWRGLNHSDAFLIALKLRVVEST